MSVEFWAEFFQAAGLEPEVAASYANIFFVNKIQSNHLPDIDRDALREMSIKPMGDILTILRYIKVFCSVVTSPTSPPANEQPLRYRYDIPRSPVRFRNIQDSKSGYCGQNHVGCDVQHRNAVTEKSCTSTQRALERLSHSASHAQLLPSSKTTCYLPSAETITTGCNLPQRSPLTVVHESQSNPNVNGNYCIKKKLINDQCNSLHSEIPEGEQSRDLHCNSVDITEPCERPETKTPTFSSLSDKLQICRDIDYLKNRPKTSVFNSGSEHCEWQQPLSLSPPVVLNTLVQPNRTVVISSVHPTKGTLPSRQIMKRKNHKCEQKVFSETSAKSTVNERFSKEMTVLPGGGTPHQKRSVFDRLGQQSNVETVWQKPAFLQFRQDQQSRSEQLLKSVPQQNNDLIRSNHLRKKRQWGLLDGINNKTESIKILVKSPGPLPEEHSCLPNETYNENISKELISPRHLRSDIMVTECCPVEKWWESVPDGNLSDGETFNREKYYFNPGNPIQGSHNSQELRNQHSLSSRIPFTEQRDDKISRADTGNEKLSDEETLAKGPEVTVKTCTSPCFSNSPENKDQELEWLKDPTCTRHTQQFYLAWADRRKCAHSFPGIKPRFLQFHRKI